MSQDLTIDVLSKAVADADAAFRCVVRLLPAGGPGSKVFPPTHSGGVYAWEKRRVGRDDVVLTVLLDSVQSQANRMEQALKQAFPVDERSTPPKCLIPIVRVDFSQHFPDIGYVTTLDAPHRIADAIFRDSLLNGTKFRESDVGRAFVRSTIRDATGLFRYCPHALVFGVWDSTGSAGGLGNKFQRAITSEIVGIQAEKGIRTSSRIDPILRSNPALYEAEEGGWTANETHARRDAEGNPVKFVQKLSELNLGNVTPDYARYNPKQDKGPLRTMHEEIRVGDVLPGGVTIDHAVQTTVLSLPALRRLRFPDDQRRDTAERNNAARTVLAALALAAVAHQREQGYDLRSRCLLIPEGPTSLELIANDGNIKTFNLAAPQADTLLESAINAAEANGLLWEKNAVTLQPEERIVDLVRRSRESIDTGEE